MQRIFAQMLPKALPGKSFAEMWDMPPGQKEANFYQMLWDLGQLDGYSLSMFENEKFSSKELRDITNVITVRSGMMQTTKGDLKVADAVVFKTDYLSHKQWYAVRDYAKKCGRKIIYCRNNIPMMFEQIERALK